MSHQFIADHREAFCVQRMCEVLGVSSSGFYAWDKREPSQREQANEALIIDIRQIYETSRQTYGSPRIHAELQAQGTIVSRKRVARLMRLNRIRAKRKQRYKVTTKPHPSREAAPNLLAQEFKADMANEKWVADITYIDIQEG